MLSRLAYLVVDCLLSQEKKKKDRSAQAAELFVCVPQLLGCMSLSFLVENRAGREIMFSRYGCTIFQIKQDTSCIQNYALCGPLVGWLVAHFVRPTLQDVFTA